MTSGRHACSFLFLFRPREGQQFRAFSMPILLDLFLQALCGAVDLLVVGKYALAQITACFVFYAHIRRKEELMRHAETSL